MRQPVDTDATLEVHQSFRGVLPRVFAALIFVVLGVWTANGGAPRSRQPEWFDQTIAYAVVAFFGWAALVPLWRLFKHRGPVITLSPAGIRDVRVAAETVPWSAVAGLSTWQMQGQSFMVVALRPGEEEKLHLTRFVRMLRKANAALGADGLAVGAHGTTISHDDLLQAAMAYANAHRSDGAA